MILRPVAPPVEPDAGPWTGVINNHTEKLIAAFSDEGDAENFVQDLRACGGDDCRLITMEVMP